MDELIKIARKHCHTEHSGINDPCYSFDRQELDMFLKDIEAWSNQRTVEVLERCLTKRPFNQEPENTQSLMQDIALNVQQELAALQPKGKEPDNTCHCDCHVYQGAGQDNHCSLC